jgi:hypothetical protein
MISRRAFTTGLGCAALGAAMTGAAAAQTAAVAGPQAAINSTFSGITLGANTGPLRGSPAAIIEILRSLGIGGIEFSRTNIEPQFTGSPGFVGSPAPGLEQVAAFNRVKLREWRLGVPLDLFRDTARRAKAGGLWMNAYNAEFKDDFTDAEYERIFDMVEALGVDVITAVGPTQALRRCDGFAKRRKIRVGMHNDTNFRGVSGSEEVLRGMSDYTGITLDTGHFVSQGGDVLEMLRKHQDRVFAIHLKDKKKDGGPNTVFGQGDVPLVEILHWLRDNKFKGVTNVEQEAAGADRTQMLRDAFQYCRQALLQG